MERENRRKQEEYDERVKAAASSTWLGGGRGQWRVLCQGVTDVSSLLKKPPVAENMPWALVPLIPKELQPASAPAAAAAHVAPCLGISGLIPCFWPQSSSALAT